MCETQRLILKLGCIVHGDFLGRDNVKKWKSAKSGCPQTLAWLCVCDAAVMYTPSSPSEVDKFWVGADKVSHSFQQCNRSNYVENLLVPRNTPWGVFHPALVDSV